MTHPATEIRSDFVVRQINGLRAQASRQVDAKRKPLDNLLGSSAISFALGGVIMGFFSSMLVTLTGLVFALALLAAVTMRKKAPSITVKSYLTFRDLFEENLNEGALGAITATAFEDIFNPRAHKDAARALSEIYSESTVSTARNFSPFCEESLKKLLELSSA